ncbi:hypothetical protein [Lentzea sp. NPDC055074]
MPDAPGLFPTTNAAGAGARPLRRAADKVQELAGVLGLRLRPDAYVEVFSRNSSVAYLST